MFAAELAALLTPDDVKSAVPVRKRFKSELRMNADARGSERLSDGTKFFTISSFSGPRVSAFTRGSIQLKI
jgi:hypothetical protein